jgi:hypothetical protein
MEKRYPTKQAELLYNIAPKSIQSKTNSPLIKCILNKFYRHKTHCDEK